MSASPLSEDDHITIKVASPVKLSIGTLLEFQVPLESTVRELKSLILARFPADDDTGPAPDRQRLIFRGQVLGDEKTIAMVLKEGKSETARSVHFHLVVKPLENDMEAAAAAAAAGSGKDQGRIGMRGLLGEARRSVFGAPAETNASTSSSRAPALQPQPPTPEPVQHPAVPAQELVQDFTTPAPSASSNLWTSIPSFSAPVESEQVASSSASSFATDIEDVYSVQMPRTQSAGLLDLSRYTYCVTDSGMPTVNFLGPYGSIIPIPIEQVAFVRNYAGELLCCLSPEALNRLSGILQRPVETEPLFCRTPIYATTELDKPTYNAALVPTSRNVYLSFPRAMGGTHPVADAAPGQAQPAPPAPAPPAQAVAEPEIENAVENNDGQAENGVHIRIGNWNFHLNFQILTVLFRVFVFIEVFAMQLESKLQFYAVSLAALVAAFWHAGMIPRADNWNMGDWLRRIPTHLPHRHPEVPEVPANGPAAAANDDRAANEAENAGENDPLLQPPHLNQNQAQQNAGQLEEPESRLNQILWSIQGVVFMFIGSLMPFVYDRWVREDQRRREHAEQVQRQAEERARIEAEAQAAQDSQAQAEVQPAALQQEEEQPGEQQQEHDEEVSETAAVETYGPGSTTTTGSSSSAQYTGTSQTLLHREA